MTAFDPGEWQMLAERVTRAETERDEAITLLIAMCDLVEGDHPQPEELLARVSRTTRAARAFLPRCEWTFDDDYAMKLRCGLARGHSVPAVFAAPRVRAPAWI